MRRREPKDSTPRGFVQLDSDGKPVTMFRDWLSPPGAEDSLFTQNELRSLSGHNETAEEDLGTPKNEFVHFLRYHTREPYYGVPQVISALAAIHGQIHSEARNLRWFINRSVPDWLVVVKTDAATLRDPKGKEEVDEFLDEIEEHMKHLVQGEDHRTMMLKVPRDTMEMEWEELSPAPKDQDYQVYQLRNRDTVIRAYRMLPHRIGIIETASLGTGTGETQEETYKRAQIDPRQEMLEEFFNQVLDEMGWTAIRFKFRDLDVLDEMREMTLLTQAVATRAVTVNEIRRWLSRIVKNQDFPDYDDEFEDPENTVKSNVPIMFVEPAGAGVAFPPGAGVEPFAPGGSAEPTPGFQGLRAPIEIDRTYEPLATQLREALAPRMKEERRRLFAAGRRNGRPKPQATATGNADRALPAPKTPLRPS
jgi:hypothetical protein